MTAPDIAFISATEPRAVVQCADLLGALRVMHDGSPIFVERKRDFLNLRTESDAVAATFAGYVTEYEIKVSRADFIRDRGKLRYQIYSGTRKGRRPNRFYYVTSPGIIRENDLPEWAGWYEWDGTGLALRRKSPRLEKELLGIDVLMRLALAMRKRT